MIQHPSIEDMLVRVFGGEIPSRKQVNRVRSIAAAMGEQENGPFVALLAALDGYWSMYAEMPDKVERAAKNAADEAERQIESVARERITKAADEVLVKLGDQVRESTKEMTEKTMLYAAGRRFTLWICGTVVVCLAACFLLAGYSLHVGHESGYSLGYANARDEDFRLRERDVFWGSALGKRVMKMQKDGRLKDVLDFADSDLGKLVNEYG